MIVFFFIDTKVGKQRIDYVRCVLGYDGFFLVDNVGRRDGLALLWRGKKLDYITWKCSEECARDLRMWGGGFLKKCHYQIIHYKREMPSLHDRWDNNLIRLYEKACQGYEQALEDYEIYWKQFAKQFWLREVVVLGPPQTSVTEALALEAALSWVQHASLQNIVYKYDFHALVGEFYCPLAGYTVSSCSN
ncbi:hypothetical protein GH714_008164 [Hevea brasiliensis]|uniref:Uncharacterized protein n=1 Tax=Hevea brasiliensis TaxID=3981 RepID=A0A6A6NA42_HEVBR|nr:hypothetical protein GH714_008164 [Hevea brasiliensis]